MEHDRLVDMDALAYRLKDLVSNEKPSAFCQRAGISHSVFSKYINPPPNLSPSLEVIARICRAGGTSIDWLVTGVGDEPSRDQSIYFVPVYDVKLAAGAGQMLDREKRNGEMPIDRALLLSLGLTSTDGLGIVEAEGDSMEPLISDGGRVLISLNDRRLTEGVFAFRLGNDLRIKRLRPIGLGGVEAISVNPIYPPERLEGDVMNHFEVIGRALWAGTIL